jgi:XPG domain containing
LTRRLNDYYQANPAPCQISYVAQVPKPDSLFDHAAIRSGLTTFPAAPFLVPVIIDALGDSETYKNVIEVVPGEADLYCGRHLKQYGGLVLTGDSDLLVHDLGTNGSVAYFKDIEPRPDTKYGALHSPLYYPATIADRLTLPKSHGLRALAFEMVMDSHGTFRKLLLQATSLKAVNTYKDRYAEFIRDYNFLPANAADSWDNSNECPIAFMEALRKLDPRISEYVLQFPSIMRCVDNMEWTGKPELGHVQVFLPFLVDCPIRTTAWEVSASLRQLAYALVKRTVPKNEQEYVFIEHRRQNDINGKGYQLPDTPLLHEACANFIRVMDQIHHRFSSLSVPDRWIAFAVCQEVEWSSSIGRPVQSTVVAQELATARVETENHVNCTWNSIQFLAQVQGVFYSLRMLQQVSHLLVSYGHTKPGLEEASILYDRLQSLPMLSTIPSLPNVISLIKKIGAENMVQAAHDILGIKEQRSPEVHETSKTAAKRKRKAGIPLISSSGGRKQISNSFELLDVE